MCYYYCLVVLDFLDTDPASASASASSASASTTVLEPDR
jgi:hypothetical protein